MKPVDVDPGACRDRVELLQSSSTTDGLRGAALTWSVLDTVWVEWMDRPSREALQAGALQYTPSCTARTRYRSDVTTAMRVRRNGKVYGIAGGPRDLDGRQRWMELDLVEVLS